MKRKRIRILRFFLALFLGSQLACPVFPDRSPKHIRIVNWNDFHSSNTARLVKDKQGEYYRGGAALLKGALSHFRQDTIPVVAVHAGDELQGSPICSITRGASQVRILNLIHPDVFTIGNHEFDYGSSRLDTLLQGWHFPVISANLVRNREDQLFVAPYKILPVGGVRIGFIGLILPELSSVVLRENIRDIKVLDPEETVRRYLVMLKDSVDIFVLVSHMGIEHDRSLAQTLPEIDVIIGGHSHTVMQHPEVENGVIIFQAGSYGRFLGKLDLWVDTEADTILRYSGKLLRLISRNFSPDSLVQSVVDSLEKIVDTDLNQVIAELRTHWIRNSRKESNIGNWIADAFRSYAGADIAFQNSGGIRKNLRKGPVTKRDFWEIAPFGNYLVTFQATGREIRAILEENLNGKHGILQVSGLKLIYNPDKPPGSRVQKILVNGEPIQENHLYSIAALNFVYDKLVHDYRVISAERETKKFEKLDREILIETAQKQKILFSKIEGRIVQTR